VLGGQGGGPARGGAVPGASLAAASRFLPEWRPGPAGPGGGFLTWAAERCKLVAPAGPDPEQGVLQLTAQNLSPCRQNLGARREVALLGRLNAGQRSTAGRWRQRGRSGLGPWSCELWRFGLIVVIVERVDEALGRADRRPGTRSNLVSAQKALSSTVDRSIDKGRGRFPVTRWGLGERAGQGRFVPSQLSTWRLRCSGREL